LSGNKQACDADLFSPNRSGMDETTPARNNDADKRQCASLWLTIAARYFIVI
jgi:hypothetical protein